MARLSIDLDKKEKAELLAKIGDRPQREAVLTAFDIPYTKRVMGRPVIDEVTKTREALRAKANKQTDEIYKQRIVDANKKMKEKLGEE